MNLKDPNRREIVVTAVAALMVSVPIGSFWAFGREGVEVISVIATGLLTLALVVLYYQQQNILDKQTDIMERELRSSIGAKGTPTAESDEVFFTLRNTGRGGVSHMFLRTEITSDTGSLQLLPGYHMLRSVEDGQVPLGPYSDLTEYKAEARLAFDRGEEETHALPFRYFVSRLSNENIETCQIEMTIEVIDEANLGGGKPREIPLVNQELELGARIEGFEPGQSCSLSDCIQSRAPQDLYPKGGPFSPEGGDTEAGDNDPQ